MTGTGKGKWWGICKDLASAMKTGRQAIMHTSQDGGQIEASVWRWWILRWKSTPSNTEKQLYLIVLRNWLNERPQRAMDGRRRWDMYPPMIEKGHLKISVQPLFCCFVQLCLLGMAQGKGMSTTFLSRLIACISTPIGCIAIGFCTYIHSVQKMKPKERFF